MHTFYCSRKWSICILRHASKRGIRYFNNKLNTIDKQISSEQISKKQTFGWGHTNKEMDKELNFSRTEPIFFREHKLLPVQLTWLLLVYGKMLYFPRHPLLVVYVECYPYNIIWIFLPKVIFDLLLTDGASTCICFFMIDVIVILFVTTGVVGRWYCHVV